MDVTLKAIAFNHISNSATKDAFSIRKNETQPIELPEWNPGLQNAAESVAAYARRQTTGQTITIKARFSCSNPAITSIQVQAVDGHPLAPGGGGGLLSTVNVLGKVKAAPVTFTNGDSGFVPFDLDDVLIAQAGVSKSEIVWNWQFRVNCGDSWTDLTTSRHRIYTVLALPTDPWKPLSGDKLDSQLPWTDVLDVAFDWAGGAQDIDSTTDSATARITRSVNALGDPNTAGVRKVTYCYDPSYVLQVSDNFDCTAFLDRIHGGQGNGEYVNCYDCATAVSSFSNILGADLWQSKMGYNFFLNHILRIGQPREHGGDFYRHEVAWAGKAQKEDPVFDACLKLDGDNTPGPEQPEHFDPLLPINLRFGDPGDKQYRFRLEANIAGTSPCKARPGTKRRRLIGVSRVIRSTNTRTELKILSEHYGFQGWKETRLLAENLLVWRFFLTGNEAPGWQSTRIRCFDTLGKMPARNQAFWTQEKNSQVVLRVDTFECASLPAAHSFLLDVLGESQLLNLKRMERPLMKEEKSNGVGDVAFTDPENMAIFFARANIVVSIRNAGPYPLFVGEFAHRFDEGLKSRPDQGGKVIEAMEYFSFPDQKFHVNDKIRINFLPGEDMGQQLLYKFFAGSGELFLQGRHVSYRPTAVGPQEVLVFGIDAEENARMQRLGIVIAD